MKGWLVLTAALAAVCGNTGELDNGFLKGVTNKRAIDYAPGEEMTFTVSFEGIRTFPRGQWFVQWERSGDDGLRQNGKVPASLVQPLVIKTSLAKPGFVRIRAMLVDGKGNVYKKVIPDNALTPDGSRPLNYRERVDKRIFFDGGAGVCPEKLSSHPEPSDFDAFWARQAARLDRVPVKAERVALSSPNSKVDLWAVQVACAGLRPVTGYLSVPKAALQGRRFPARLETQGYDRDVNPHRAPGRVLDDVIAFNINAHGMKLPAFGATAADQKALRWEVCSAAWTYAFDPAQNEDPEVAYFNGMMLRVKRALQFLKTLPEWDGKNLIATGGSQGGLQTIWAAGCGEGVTRAESGITWCCDLYTSGKLRRDANLKLSGDGWYIPWTEAMGYYDAVNFAKRIPCTCRTIISRAGLGDYCCPPTGLAKLYNNIPGNKQINWVQGSTHDFIPPEPNQAFSLEFPEK